MDLQTQKLHQIWVLQMSSYLKISNICKKYDDKVVLSNVNMHLKQGEIISLLGASGCGKTTLFNVISGITPSDSGQIILKGEDVTGKSGIISYMLQKDLLLPFKTVIENVALPLIIKGVKKEKAINQANEHFKTFGLEGYQKKYPKELSGGMCQRVAFLRTYMFSNEIALLDEPFSALDAITKSNLQQWYLDIMQKIQLSTIFITHDIDEAILLSDRIYILSNNEISSEITIDIEKPRSREFLLTQEFLDYKREILQLI